MPITYTCVRYPTSKILFTKKKFFLHSPGRLWKQHDVCKQLQGSESKRSGDRRHRSSCSRGCDSSSGARSGVSLVFIHIHLYALFRCSHHLGSEHLLLLEVELPLLVREQPEDVHRVDHVGQALFLYTCQMLLRSEQEKLMKKKALIPFDRLCLS